ncbi:TIGR01777 family oxidoreductase [Kangiella koreensis]|uniref:NAD-dependent epimerase/dehydratase n=1 Tax=Kangiella koreensis (strain DSM 16069 / JCM 12317 / KCTC 12182 / SW-125) TaxID=523791 RepID=C7RAX1_KANKD|nr:TIGR01777 family oxidoreductase [Kangiella koreensis]ACV26413.1 domain of unknown function DUF1731 [Kangiella koreensis DSM 16069]
METILVTGGTGFIGRNLIPLLQKDNYNIVVLSRTPTKYEDDFYYKHVKLIENLSEVKHADIVINLAGANLSAKRWTDKYKQEIVNSRLDLTENLIDWMTHQERKPHTLISGSAIGYYGPRGNETLDENSTSGNASEFQVRLCSKWEDTAYRAESLGLRVCCIRTGVVLGNQGALSQMLLPFKFGLGGKLGSGNQYFSWIHILDHVRAIKHIIDNNSLSGSINLTAPNPVTNETLTKTLGKVLGRPTFMTVPGFALKVVMGEMAHILLTGQRVVPHKLEESGFNFEFPELEQALHQILK